MLPDFVAKLCPRAELLPRLAGLARPVVFTNGVFDILHRGHVTYLAQARSPSLLSGRSCAFPRAFAEGSLFRPITRLSPNARACAR